MSKHGRFSVDPIKLHFFLGKHFYSSRAAESLFFRLLLWCAPRRNFYDGDKTLDGGLDGLPSKEVLARMLGCTEAELEKEWPLISPLFAMDEESGLYAPLDEDFILYGKVIDRSTGRAVDKRLS